MTHNTKQEEKRKMVWFALFKPHPDCKFMVVPCDEYLVEPLGTIKEYMHDGEPFTVKFERHLEGWNNQFPEV